MHALKAILYGGYIKSNTVVISLNTIIYITCMNFRATVELCQMAIALFSIRTIIVTMAEVT